MPAASTPALHSRRRRRIKTPASIDKENEPNAANNQRPAKTFISFQANVSFEKGSVEKAFVPNNDALKHFLQVSKVLTIESPIKSNTALAECVMMASLCNQSNSGLLLLEEHSASLLGSARKLIKEATESKNKGKLGYLVVAAHILRAIGPLFQEREKQEMCFRLLYHLITASTDIFLKMGDCQALFIVVAGYDALGRILTQYSSTAEEETIGFEYANGNLIEGYHFATPTRNKKSSCVGTMPFRQVATIVLKTTLSVASCCIHTWLTPSLKTNILNDKSAYFFGNDVQSMVVHNFEQSIAPHRFVTEVMETGYLPWLTFSADLSGKETAKEISLNCKAAHRLLWDAASKLKEAGAKIDKQSLESHCLDLRRSAIGMLLPSVSKRNIYNFLQREHFESACSYAWKASSVFAQHTGLHEFPAQTNNPLHDFHNQIGQSIEFFRPSTTLPLSYAEYCSYRCIQTGWGEKVMIYETSENCEDSVCSILWMLQLCIYFRQRLQTDDDGMIQSTPLALKLTNVDVISYTQQVIEKFEQSILNQFTTLSQDVRNRISKLFTMISLHRCIFVALKENKWPGKQVDLLGAAMVLSKCIGLFSIQLIQASGDDPRIAMLCDTATESFIRPISALETLVNDYVEAGDPESAQSLIEFNDEIMEQFFDFLTFDGISISPAILGCTEKAAKSLSILARQRTEKAMNLESLRPQLYALKLYSKLQKLKPSINNNLAARYAQLATTLQALGKNLEACYALSLVLASEAPISYLPTGEDSSRLNQMDIIQFLMSSSGDVIFPIETPLHATKLAKTATRWLLDVLCNSREHWKGMQNDLSTAQESMEPVSVLDILTNSLLSNDLNELNKFENIGQIVGYAFRENRDGMPFEGTCLLYRHFMLMVDLVHSLGKSLCQGSERLELIDTGNKEWFQQQYQSIVGEAISTLEMIGTSQYSFVYGARGLLYLVASSSLLPFRTFYNDALAPTKLREAPWTSLARAYSEMCRTAFQPPDSKHVQSGFLDLCRCLGFIGEQYDMFLNCYAFGNVISREKILHLISHGGQIIEELCKSACTSIEAGKMASKILVWSCSRILNGLERDGDFVNAAMLADWIQKVLDCASLTGVFWFCSISISTRLNCGAHYQGMGRNPDRSILQKNSSCWTVEDYEKAEMFVCSIRANLLGSENFSFSSSPSQDLELLKSIVDEQEERLHHETRWISKWLLTTIELAQAEISSTCGDFHTALRHVQNCIRLCQDGIHDKIALLAPSGGHSFWVNVAASGHLGRVTQRLITLFSRRSYLYQQIGDHRKSVTNLLAAGQILGVEIGKDCLQNLGCLVSLFESSVPLAQRQFFRFLVSTQSTALAFDLVEGTFASANLSPMVPIQGLIKTTVDYSRHFETIRDLLSVGDNLYADHMPSDSQNLYVRYYEEALSVYESVRKIDDLKESFSNELNCIRPQLQLRKARLVMATASIFSGEDYNEIFSLCSEVTTNAVSPTEDKAWAYYYLGFLKVNEAQQNGELFSLWGVHDTVVPSIEKQSLVSGESRCIGEAKAYLLAAATASQMDTRLLSRNILRSLALVSGPERGSLSVLAAGILVISSIGRSSNEFMRRLRHDNQTGGVEPRMLTDIFEAMSVFDGDLRDVKMKDTQVQCFFNSLRQIVPTGWKFVATALCPSGELLLTSVEKAEANGRICVATECKFARHDRIGIYDEIMKPLDGIIQRSQSQLNGMDPTAVSEHFSKESVKRMWWEKRGQLDDELSHLLETAESQYFGSFLVKTNNESGRYGSNSIDPDDFTSFPCDNLASRFEAACNISDEGCVRNSVDVESLKKLTVVKLKERLRSHGVADKEMRKLRKQQLIEMLIDKENNLTQVKNEEESEVKREVKSERESSDHPAQREKEYLFLILDENFSRFPFEGMACLQNRNVCRVPSLFFVFEALLRHGLQNICSSEVEASNISYILDPEGNLQCTRQRLEPVLEALRTGRNCRWEKCIGEMPTSVFVENCLRREKGLFLYFGHGGGQICFSRKQVEGLSKNGTQSTWPRLASIILMGCSSGRLMSVNRKNTESVEQLPIHYEPEGIALSYLCAGAPCVVGNLWDVTDHDIDRFSVSLLESFFNTSEAVGSLSEHISRARGACKMRYIVGCAPVCYGIPVHMKN